MEWLQWGKQGDIFGIPIPIVLIVQGLYRISDITNLRFYYTSDLDFFLGLGTIFLNSTIGEFTRLYLLMRVIVAVLWGLTTLLNALVLKRSTWIASMAFSLACIYFALANLGLIYAIVLYVRGDYMEFNPALPLLRSQLVSFPWPSHFWVYWFVTFLWQSLLFTIILDMHFSYIKILGAGGTGWESKPYYQIEQQKNETERTPLLHVSDNTLSV